MDHSVHIHIHTGWAKKRGYSKLCLISNKLPKIFARFLNTSSVVYTEYVYSHRFSNFISYTVANLDQ